MSCRNLRARHVALLLSLAALVLAAFVVPAVAKKDRALDRADRRFDHAEHSKLVTAKLGKDEPCAGLCHTMTDDFRDWKRGPNDKKEHERCYDGCHKGFRHRYTTERGSLKGMVGRTCFPCHGSKLKYRPDEDNLGAVAGESEVNHVAAFSHRTHISSKASSGKQCEACHGKWGNDRGSVKGTLAAGHDYCSACHARAAEPSMKSCDGCHIDRESPEGKAPVVKPRKPNPYAVGGSFSHESHAKLRRVGSEGRTCLTCHNNIDKAKDDSDVPLPTMQGCFESCHDGNKAFSVTGTRCSACHKRK